MKAGESKDDKQVISDEAAAEAAYQATKFPEEFANRAEFDAALAAHKGDESIKLNGRLMRINAGETLDYYTHSPDGRINNVGPNN